MIGPTTTDPSTTDPYTPEASIPFAYSRASLKPLGCLLPPDNPYLPSPSAPYLRSSSFCSPQSYSPAHPHSGFTPLSRSVRIWVPFPLPHSAASFRGQGRSSLGSGPHSPVHCPLHTPYFQRNPVPPLKSFQSAPQFLRMQAAASFRTQASSEMPPPQFKVFPFPLPLPHSSRPSHCPLHTSHLLLSAPSTISTLHPLPLPFPLSPPHSSLLNQCPLHTSHLLSSAPFTRLSPPHPTAPLPLLTSDPMPPPQPSQSTPRASPRAPRSALPPRFRSAPPIEHRARSTAPSTASARPRGTSRRRFA